MYAGLKRPLPDEGTSTFLRTNQTQGQDQQLQLQLKKVRQFIKPDAIERDPGKRALMSDIDPSIRDEFRHAYLQSGPYQPILDKYPQSKSTATSRIQQSLVFKWCMRKMA